MAKNIIGNHVTALLFKGSEQKQALESSMELLSGAAWSKPVNAGKQVDADLREAFREVLECQENVLISRCGDRLMSAAVGSVN